MAKRIAQNKIMTVNVESRAAVLAHNFELSIFTILRSKTNEIRKRQDR